MEMRCLALRERMISIARISACGVPAGRMIGPNGQIGLRAGGYALRPSIFSVYRR
jgi:hypothetical protein